MSNPYQQYMYSYPHKTAYRSLPDLDLREYIKAFSGKENSLYFHVPFCQYKCGYCNLFSVTGQTETRFDAYLDAVERQAEQLAGILPERTEFMDFTLGGGTPLLLRESQLRRVFRIAGDYFGFPVGERPVVVETSPNQTTIEKLTLLKELGVTRVSMGVQSLWEEELKTLHRFHSAESARRAAALIREMEFGCFNMDLIYGIPGQSWESMRASVEQALAYEPEELFVYPLYAKKGTELERRGIRQSENIFLLGKRTREYLRENGYQPYSMRRFVRRSPRGAEQAVDQTVAGIRDAEQAVGQTVAGSGNAEQAVDQTGSGSGDVSLSSEIPVSLCGFGNTLSLGCGGRSYVGRLHYCTPYAVRQSRCQEILEDFMGQTDFLHISHGFLLSEEEQRRRYVIRHILYGGGLDRIDYRKHFSGEAETDFPILLEWIHSGYAVQSEQYITLTEEGVLLSDYLGPQLISEEVRQRSEEFYRR